MAVADFEEVVRQRRSPGDRISPGVCAAIAIAAIVVAALIGVVRQEAVWWRFAGWVIAGLGATTAVSFYGRQSLRRGRRPLVWLIVALNLTALGIAVWHAVFVTRRLL